MVPTELGQLVEKLRKIRDKGFVKTHRAHDTGIGKTLEDLLGIEENNLKLPDVGDVELKAARAGSNSMLTLATKSPDPKSANRQLFERYKYQDSRGHECLHSTVSGSRTNRQGLKVTIDKDKLVLENAENIEAYWPVSIFNDVLKSKSDSIMLVFADTKGKRATKGEQFHFTEAYLLSNLNKDKFRSAIKSGKLKVDIRIGLYRSGKNAGRYHDHGTGFRIFKRDFLKLFDHYHQLL